jgi:hypothetical protein
MEKIEKVFKQLSRLYEFNRKLQTYKIQTSSKLKGQQSAQPDREEIVSVSGEVIGAAG